MTEDNKRVKENGFFQRGDRVVVKAGYSYHYNMAGTVLYIIRPYIWVEFDNRVPDICKSFPEDCPQARWGRVRPEEIKHLTTEKGTKLNVK